MAVTVRAVGSEHDFSRFVELAPRLHRGEPCWVPPIRDLYVRMLSREANAYFRHADAEYLLAWQDGEVVGHVIAHIDHHLNDHRGTRWGLFGFFDAVDDQAVADALFDAAAAWLRERGCDRMVGPLQFSTKEDPGLLIEGNDRRPVVLQPWHPVYYRRLLEGAGLTKAKDVVWREIVLDDLPPLVLTQLGRWDATATGRHGVTIRQPDQQRPEADMERLLRFMHPIFGSDWGYAPWTDAELGAGIDMAVQLLAPGTLMAEKDGELVGGSMMIPDFRQTLRNVDGWAVPGEGKIDQARLTFMAVAPGYRHLGIMAALSKRHIDRARERGVKGIVAGWSYEDNAEMNGGMAGLNLEVARRHRIYQRELEPVTSE